MNYADARSQIQTGDLIAWRHNEAKPNFVSWLISRVTGGAHTHVGVAWWFWDRLFVIEAKERVGVQLRALSNTGNFDWLPTNIEWSSELEAYAFAHLGKPYSYLDAVRVGLGFNVRDDGFICSEFVAAIYRQANAIGWPEDLSVTPTQLVRFWLDNGAPLKAVRI